MDQGRLLKAHGIVGKLWLTTAYSARQSSVTLSIRGTSTKFIEISMNSTESRQILLIRLFCFKRIEVVMKLRYRNLFDIMIMN